MKKKILIVVFLYSLISVSEHQHPDHLKIDNVPYAQSIQQANEAPTKKVFGRDDDFDLESKDDVQIQSNENNKKRLNKKTSKSRTKITKKS